MIVEVVGVYRLRASWSIDFRLGQNTLTDTIPANSGDTVAPVSVGDGIEVSGSGRIVDWPGRNARVR